MEKRLWDWPFVILLVITLVAGTLLTGWSVVREDGQMKDQLLMEGQIVANAINWRFVEKLNGNSSDIESPEYQRLKEQLTRICSAHPIARFVYLMGEKNNGSVFFFVDSEPDDSEDYSPPGEIYTEASRILKQVFITGVPTTEGPLPDHWGTWVSCLIPLQEPESDEVLAILGMDISAKQWNLQLFQTAVIPGGITLLLLLVEVSVFIFRNRTQRENKELILSEARLSESELKFRTIVQNAQAIIFILDKEGNFLLSEGLALSQLGLKPGQVVGLSSLEMYKDFPDVILGVRKALKGEEQRSVVNIRDIVFDTLFSPVVDKAGTVTMVIGIATDITELVEAKNKAEESDRLKSAFLANMSHEIRTPMNGIVGFAQLLTEPGFSEEEKLHFVDTINRNALDLLAIIHDIVDISKIESGQAQVTNEVIDINKLFNELEQLFQPEASKNGVKLVLNQEIPEHQNRIISDPAKLNQVLKNLLTNAFKFTDEGEIVLTAAERDGNLIFTVKDSGVGIEPKFHELIFDRFRQAEYPTTSKYRGTGLGLSISRAYMKMLGGHIGLESATGKGSTFKVELPLQVAEEPLKDQPERLKNKSSDRPDWSDRTILLVEDEEDNAWFFKEVLKSSGVTILWADTGSKAIDMFQNHPEVDLIIMDIKVPEVDGLEVTRRVKAARPDLPVIATTAFALAGDKEKCLDAGCYEYFAKPVRIQLFLKTLGKYIR
ncbi:ATP-binding protein [Bacteroidota bacterium]